MRQLRWSRVLLWLGAALLPVGMLAQTYRIQNVNPAQVTSTANGAALTLTGTLPSNFAAGGFAYCFYTGYGASATPIAPVTTNPMVINVPASTINSVPSAAFLNGTFNASLYAIQTSLAVVVACTGNADGTLTNTYAFPIVQTPVITAVAPGTIPQKNAAIGTQPPPLTVTFSGTGLYNNAIVPFSWAGGSAIGTVIYATGTSLVATVPATIPATVTSMTASVCTAQGNFCAAPLTIPLTALSASAGTLTAAPNPATVQQNVVLNAQFQATGAGSVTAGAPTGTVTFASGGNTLGTGKLTLDTVTGTLTAGTAATASSGAAGNVLMADLNRDGVPDALFFDPAGKLHALLGTAPGTSFQPETVSAGIPNCSFVNNFAVGDLNGDGSPDVAAACGMTSGPYFVAVLLSNGDGTFSAPVTISGIAGSLVAIGDMDRDGVRDLVVDGVLPTTPGAAAAVGFAVYKGKGDGVTFTLLTSTTRSVNQANSGDILVADLDKDGYPDVILLNSLTQGANSIDVYHNNNAVNYGTASGNSSAPSARITLPANPALFNGLLSGDFNGDGLLDLGSGTADTVPGSIVTALNTSKVGTISFGAPSTLAVTTSVALAADVNGDGFTDIVTRNGNTINVYDSDGKGNFRTSYSKLTATPAGVLLRLAVADMNSDGDADAVAFTVGANNNLTTYLTSGAANASLTTSFAQSGTAAVTATWPGNINMTGSTANLSLPVNGAASVTTLQSSGTPTEYGQPVTLTAKVASGGANGTPTGLVTFKDGGTALAAPVQLNGGSATLNLTTLSAGPHSLSVSYGGDLVFAGGVSGNLPQTVTQAQPTVTWTPSPANITYGTPLVAGQLNAAVASKYFPTVPGALNYTPALGAVLGAGQQTLGVNFTPTDTADFKTATGTATLTVAKATPTVTWTPPAAIVVGTPLSATQLNATATGINGTLPGVFTYTPAAGTVLAAGANQALSVLFTPTDIADYNPAVGNTTITVIPLAITTVAPNSAIIGAAATAITLTGTGFLPNSTVSVNGTPLATFAYVNATTMTAVIPAASLLTLQTLKITVTDPTQGMTSAAANFTVAVPPVVAVFSGPSTVQPTQQPPLTFTLTNPYPVALTGTLTLSFAGVGGANDPAIQFATGGTTETFTVPANTTTTPTIQLQSGTDAGTITVTLVLTAAGQVVTPANIQPLVITIPPAPPVITSMTLTRSGDTVTANIIGYSNTRTMSQAFFQFTPASGSSLSDSTVAIPAAGLFAAWYTTAGSQTYGSNFMYTQTFNLSADQSTIGSVTVTLTNSAGSSATATAQ